MFRKGVLLLAICQMFLAGSLRAQWKIVAANLLLPVHYDSWATDAIVYNDDVLWVGDRDLYSSTDLGLTWKKHPFAHAINQIVFHDRLTGLISSGGESFVYLTNDGGNTWKAILYCVEGISAVAFGQTTDIIHVLTTEPGIIRTSRDGGITWSSTSLSPFGLNIATSGSELVAMCSDLNHPYVHGWITVSTDDGISWTAKSAQTDGDTYGIAIDSCDPNRIYLANENWVGHDDNNSDMIVTNNSGDSWTKTFSHQVDYLSGTIATSTKVIYSGTVYGQGVLRSTDRGVSWKNIGGPSVAGDSRSMVAIDDETLYLLDGQGNLWETTNSGGDSVFTIPAIRADTRNVSADTVGLNEIRIPIRVLNLLRSTEVELTLHYTVSDNLLYLGSFTSKGVSMDIPGEQWQGRSRLHFTTDADGSLTGDGHFVVITDAGFAPTVWFDSILVPDEIAPCELTDTTTAVSYIQTPFGCGIDMLNSFIHRRPINPFQVIPNPSSGRSEVVTSVNLGLVRLEIFDMSGSLRYSADELLNISDPIRLVVPLPSGVYSIRVQSTQGSFERRVVVSK